MLSDLNIVGVIKGGFTVEMKGGPAVPFMELKYKFENGYGANVVRLNRNEEKFFNVTLSDADDNPLDLSTNLDSTMLSDKIGEISHL